MRRFPSAANHILLVALGLLLGALMLEGVLRLFMAFAAPQVEPIIAMPQVETTVADERLGYRPNPAYPGHDARGWRNAVALAQADVVVLGDSQTYGNNAAANEAWPQRLAVHLRRSVYQMAFGGYGPAHYVPLLDEALTLRPKVILAGYYFGNDLYDSYWLVYRVGTFYKHKRSSSDPAVAALATSDPGMRAAIAETESRDPKHLRVWYLDCAQPPFKGADPSQLLRGPISHPREEIEQQAPAASTRPRRAFSQWLSGRSLLYRTVWPRLRPRLTLVLGEPSADVASIVESSDPPHYGSPLCVDYRDGGMRTIFQAGYRLVALDDSDPRGVEGERISLLAFKHLAERVRRAGIHFYVVLIPTKETAFRARAEAALQNERLLVELWQAEARARKRATNFFAREGVRTIDTLPVLAGMIASGVNPYEEPKRDYGHPVARGYDRIARAIAARLEKDDVWRP